MRRVLLPLLLVAVSCGGGNEQIEAKHPPGKTDGGTDAARVKALDSVRVADVPAGTFGPYVAETPSGALVAWAAATGAGSRGWFAVSVDAAGKLGGKPVSLGAAPNEVGLAIVESAVRGSDDKPSYVLLNTRHEGEKSVIEARRIGPKAEPLSGPVTLADPAGEIIWLDLVATDGAPIALYGVRKADGADLFAMPVPIDAGSKLKPTEVAKNARAWQAAPFGAGAGVGLVVAAPNETGGHVEVAMLDETGNATSRVPVSTSPSAESDLDMVAVGNGLVLAWSDHRDVESRVFLAALDSGGKITHPPAPAISAVGEQALVRLVPPHDRVGPAYLAWENLLERPVHGRNILLAPVNGDGNVSPARTELRHEAADSVPELAASKNGLAALGLAPACRKGQECVNPSILPTFIELDRSLELLVSEPVKMTALAGEAPDLAWGLGCVGSICHVLAAQATDPAPVYMVSLSTLSLDWQPAVRRPEASTPPRAASLEAIASLEPLADVALAKLAQTSLAAWVTYFDPSAPYEPLKKPASDGRTDPPRALLQVRALSEGQTTQPTTPVTITIRARSLGGVALASATSAPAEALLGWTALDNKVPQVFATVVDASAKKLRQRMLTRAPGEKSDVAAAGLGDGWIAAWVDERGGDPEVYAAKLNRQLISAGPEKRITNAKGAAADIALVTLGQNAIMAWSDARDASRPGWADIFVTVLKGADASALAPEQAVAKTTLHSHSPELAVFGKGALIAWIDSSPTDAGGNGEAMVMLVELDENGHAKGTPISVKPAQGVPTAVAVDCAADRCHLVMTVAVGEAGMLQTFDYTSTGVSRPRRLVSLTGPASSTVAPALIDREVLYADRAENAGRVRRMLVEWR